MESLESNYYTIQNIIQSLLDKKVNVVQDNLTEERKKLDSLKEKVGLYEEHEELFNQKGELYDAALRLLRDDGIKSLIISQYIPVINKLINRYLEKMNFGVSFTLDENFNEEMKSRYRDKFTYDSFSEGEKQRIDIALLQTWRSVAEMKNSMSTNLLLLDEVFDSSLDVDGMEDYLEILKGVSQKNNIYIISHKLENVASFDRVIRVDKVGDFSYIDYE
jgi:DNA repair exonuclease SbcCD ATPase subunit